jgi:hypothetical protein
MCALTALSAVFFAPCSFAACVRACVCSCVAVPPRRRLLCLRRVLREHHRRRVPARPPCRARRCRRGIAELRVHARHSQTIPHRLLCVFLCARLEPARTACGPRACTRALPRRGARRARVRACVRRPAAWARSPPLPPPPSSPALLLLTDRPPILSTMTPPLTRTRRHHTHHRARRVHPFPPPPLGRPHSLTCVLFDTLTSTRAQCLHTPAQCLRTPCARMLCARCPAWP